jgi:membrane-associated phospholipid phosphatase
MPTRLLSTLFLAAGLFAAQLVAIAAPEAGLYLKPADVDLKKIIPEAPANDSLATKADLETVYNVQLRRTPEQVAIATYFANDNVFQFDAVIGPWFNAKNLPKTAEFFEQIRLDRFAISTKGKEYWNRPRPPLVDPRIKACIELPASGSYPSGHSTQAYTVAGLLGEIFPELKDALRERARLVAWSRIVGGVHYPSDIVAGQILGDYLAQDFLKVPAVREAIASAKAEAAAFQKPAAKH